MTVITSLPPLLAAQAPYRSSMALRGGQILEQWDGFFRAMQVETWDDMQRWEYYASR